MESNQAFWLTLWKYVTVVIVSAITTIGGCTAYESHMINEAIRGGVDAIDARCGIAGSANSGREQCLLRAAGR